MVKLVGNLSTQLNTFPTSLARFPPYFDSRKLIESLLNSLKGRSVSETRRGGKKKKVVLGMETWHGGLKMVGRGRTLVEEAEK